MNYFEHNDAQLAEIRRIAAAHNADRQRMLNTMNERDMGCVTLYMSKHELHARCREAARTMMQTWRTNKGSNYDAFFRALTD